MKKLNYKVVSIVCLIICIIACTVVFSSHFVKIPDVWVRVTGTICLISVVVNVFSFAKFYKRQ